MDLFLTCLNTDQADELGRPQADPPNSRTFRKCKNKGDHVRCQSKHNVYLYHVIWRSNVSTWWPPYLWLSGTDPDISLPPLANCRKSSDCVRTTSKSKVSSTTSCFDSNTYNYFSVRDSGDVVILVHHLGNCCQSQWSFQWSWNGFRKYAVLHGANKVPIDIINRKCFCKTRNNWSLFIVYILCYHIKKSTFTLPSSFSQDTLHWSRSWRRFVAFAFHLDAVCEYDSASEAVLSSLWQSGSRLGQNSRRQTGVMLDVAARANTNTRRMFHIKQLCWMCSSLRAPMQLHIIF